MVNPYYDHSRLRPCNIQKSAGYFPISELVLWILWIYCLYNWKIYIQLIEFRQELMQNVYRWEKVRFNILFIHVLVIEDMGPGLP